jgi:hypothetical protein
MEPNLNKKQFLQKQYASFINYEPAKSWDMCFNSQNVTLGISKYSWKNPLDVIPMARYKISIRGALSFTYIGSPKLLWV